MDHERATIDKMINFIYFEAKEKINELKAKAIEDYNTEKSRLIKERSDVEELELKKRLNELKISRLKRVSEVKLEYKLELARRKEARVNALVEIVKKRLRGVHLNQQLINQTMDVVGDETDVVVYVLARDRSRVSKGEVRELDSDKLGGIVVMSRDGTVLVDNSYLTRLEKMREQHMPRISKELFKGRERVK